MDATKKAAENNTIFSSSEATSGTVSAQIATYPGRPARRVLSSLEYLQSSNRTIIQWRIIHATTPIEGRLKIGRPSTFCAGRMLVGNVARLTDTYLLFGRIRKAFS